MHRAAGHLQHAVHVGHAVGWTAALKQKYAQAEALGRIDVQTVEMVLDQLSEVDNDQLRAIIEADPPTTVQEVAEELNVYLSALFGI